MGSGTPLEPNRESVPGVKIRFRWPGQGPSGECDNFFLGIWHPLGPIHVDWSEAPSLSHVVQRGPNWLLASATSPHHPAGTGLVHAAPDASGAVAFRGYIVPRLHSYSPSREIQRYWTHRLATEHNGVFSAAVIGDDGRTLTLITDVLGMGPLYYRMLGDAIVFATNPRYLTIPGDGPDLLAWRSLIQTSWVVGDRSLYREVRRLPAGHTLRVDGRGQIVTPWFDFDRLPAGKRAVGPTAVSEVEEALEQAIGRCLELQAGSIALPLSSGFDSRRMLAIMLKRKVDFQAITCRTYQKSHRDLDARYAQEMARDFGFAHRIVEPGTYQQYAADDVARRVLVDSETREHSWALSVMKALPERPSLFFDGIGGDILGDPVGWSVHVGLTVEARSPDIEVDAIAKLSIRNTFDSVLSSTHWPDVEDMRREVKGYVRSFLPRENLSELAFLLLRQRRAIAPWSQQLLPPGHVAVCPYLDLEYLRVLLGFTSVGKHATKFQRACLREFWPDLYRYPGNRDIPEEVPPGSPDLEDNRALRCYIGMRDEVEARGSMRLVREMLTPKGRLVLRTATWSRAIQIRSLWYLHPLMELVHQQAHRRPCWDAG